MSAQLNIRGNIIELEEQITYNFQAGDIADFSAIKSNYTSSFKIPKTQDIVRLFEGLGIPSDTSRLPYTITDVQCLDDHSIVYEGSLVILHTDSLYYHSTVISGAKVFSDSISDLTLYDVVGSEITNKTPDNVLAKLRDNSASPTKYLLADYGGEREIFGRYGAIDIDLLAESVSVSFLLDSIFALSGFTYSIPSTIDLSTEYLALPIPPLIDYVQVSQRVVSAQKITASSGIIPPSGNITGYESWDSVFVETVYFNQSDSWNFVCTYPGDYVIIFHSIIAKASASVGQNWYPLTVELKVNGQLVGQFSASTQPIEKNELYRTVIGLDPGDIVEIDLIKPPQQSGSILEVYEVNNIDYGIYNISSDSDKLRDALDLSLTDFIKEFCYRYALIPIHDGNIINFIGFHDIIDDWDVVDWTDRYIYRNNETYTLNYGNNNWLKHSYVDEVDTHFNLNVPSGNANAPVNNDIIVSKIFAPNRNGIFGIYDSNLQGDGTFTTKTNNRFYWIQRTRRFTTEEIRVASRTVPGYIVAVGGAFNYAEYTAAFSDSERWRSLERIIQGLRVHKIDLHITTVDVAQLDITRIYYFEQEQAYYMLNRLAYTKGKITNAEFVKVNCVWGWEGVSQYCLLDTNNENTGYYGYENLVNNLTGESKPNLPSDPDYIPPVIDEDACPIPVWIPIDPYCEQVAGVNTGYRVYANIEEQISGTIRPNLPGDPHYYPPTFLPSECPIPIRIISFTDREFLTVQLNNSGLIYTLEARQGSTVIDSITDENTAKDLTWTGVVSGYVFYNGNRDQVISLSIPGNNTAGVTNVNVSEFENIERVSLPNAPLFQLTLPFPPSSKINHLDLNIFSGSPLILNNALSTLDHSGVEGGYFRYNTNNITGVQPTNSVNYNSLINKNWTIIGRPPL